MYRSAVRWTSAECWLGRRVLVTGASGFLGRAVVAGLQGAGAEVWGTWRSRPLPTSIPGEPATLPGDATELVARVRPDVVLHLASPVDLRRDAALLDTLRPGILDASVAIARACLDHGVRLVQVGTCEEYGDGDAPFREDAAARPVSPYSALKAAATHAVLMMTRVAGLDATVVRPFRCYGIGDTKSVIAAAAEAALLGRPFPMTDGAQVREWNDVDAVAAGILAAGAHPGARGRVLNLGGGERRSVRGVVAAVFAAAGADPALVQAGALPRRGGEVARFWGDHTASEALWGPLAQAPLDDGLAEVVAWHRRRLADSGHVL